MLMYQKILIRRLELYVISSLFLFVHSSFFRLGLFRICFVKLAILITNFPWTWLFFFKYCFYLYTISTILIRSQVESTFVCCWLYQVYHQFKKVGKKVSASNRSIGFRNDNLVLFELRNKCFDKNSALQKNDAQTKRMALSQRWQLVQQGWKFRSFIFVLHCCEKANGGVWIYSCAIVSKKLLSILLLFFIVFSYFLSPKKRHISGLKMSTILRKR